MKITYAITVCDEFKEIQTLLKALYNVKRMEDEVVILLDTTKAEALPELLTYLRNKENYPGKLIEDEFTGHFAEWKNKLTEACSGEYIFQIDADEVPEADLIRILPYLLRDNPHVEVYRVPRVNTVKGITEEHIRKWGWNCNAHGWINWPDYQMRLYKNKPEIRWVNKVHEVLSGYKTIASLPETKSMALLHYKDIERQEKQNSFYSTL